MPIGRPPSTVEQLAQSRFDLLDAWDDPELCWNWTGAVGLRKKVYYGQHTWEGKKGYVHRWFYEWLVGPIPDGYEIDHLCFNTLCCNPAHLEAVTPSENRKRSRRATEQRGRTHCPHGHPYSGHNLIVRRGKRECRTCVYTRNARRRQAKKGW